LKSENKIINKYNSVERLKHIKCILLHILIVIGEQNVKA